MTEMSARRAQTRRRLFAAAITEFAERGIGGTSVEQICTAAGFSRGAFYSNFTSKIDLCIGILDEDRALTYEQIERALPFAQEKGIDWVINEGMLILQRIFREEDDYTLTMMEIRLRAMSEPELAQRLREHEEATRPAGVKIISDLADALGVKFLVDPKIAWDMLEAAFMQVFVDPYCDPDLPGHTLALLVGRPGPEKRTESD